MLTIDQEISICYIEKYYSQLPNKEKTQLSSIRELAFKDMENCKIIKERILDYIAYNLDEMEVNTLLLLNNIIKELDKEI